MKYQKLITLALVSVGFFLGWIALVMLTRVPSTNYAILAVMVLFVDAFAYLCFRFARRYGSGSVWRKIILGGYIFVAIGVLCAFMMLFETLFKEK